VLQPFTAINVENDSGVSKLKYRKNHHRPGPHSNSLNTGHHSNSLNTDLYKLFEINNAAGQASNNTELNYITPSLRVIECALDQLAICENCTTTCGICGEGQ
jgi:hypothetical protein